MGQGRGAFRGAQVLLGVREAAAGWTREQVWMGNLGLLGEAFGAPPQL